MKQHLPESIVCWLTLAFSVVACTSISTPAPPPPVFWRTTQSPVFPNEWPPTSATVWTRYTFAYGSSSTGLADGMYVSRPLTRTEVNRHGQVVAETNLNNPLESIDTQGVVPLSSQQQVTLAKRAQVERYLLQLVALPAANRQTADLREFYRLWFQFNGAFVKQIRSDHAVFLDWINRDQ